MDTSSLIAAFTPSKIIIQTSVLPVITVDPKQKSWLGDFLNPKVYAIMGDSVVKIDPATGKVSLSSQEELNALPDNWGNMIALAIGGIFAVLVLRRLFKGVKK